MDEQQTYRKLEDMDADLLDADDLYWSLMYGPDKSCDYTAFMAAAMEPTTTRLQEILDAVAALSLEQRQHRNFDEITIHAAWSDLNYLAPKTPLLVAIDAERIENVRLFLKAGTPADGVRHNWYIEENSHFRRFWKQYDEGFQWNIIGDKSYDELNLNGDSLSLEDIERRYKSLAVLWDDERLTGLDPNNVDHCIQSLVRAAAIGNIQIFEEIWASKARRSHWLLDSDVEESTDDLPSLSVTTPLHMAVEKNDIKMLKHLLFKRGFDPNIIPQTAKSLGQSPLHLCFSNANIHMQAFHTIMKHPVIDPDRRTPIYMVHLLHFAITHLELEVLLELVEAGVSLSSAGTTALGHTLLHVACLPPTQLHVQVFGPKIFESIHELGQPIADGAWLVLSGPDPRPIPQFPQPRAPNVDGPGSNLPNDGSENSFFGLLRSWHNYLPEDIGPWRDG